MDTADIYIEKLNFGSGDGLSLDVSNDSVESVEADARSGVQHLVDEEVVSHYLLSKVSHLPCLIDPPLKVNSSSFWNLKFILETYFFFSIPCQLINHLSVTSSQSSTSQSLH